MWWFAVFLWIQDLCSLLVSYLFVLNMQLLFILCISRNCCEQNEENDGKSVQLNSQLKPLWISENNSFQKANKMQPLFITKVHFVCSCFVLPCLESFFNGTMQSKRDFPFIHIHFIWKQHEITKCTLKHLLSSFYSFKDSTCC